VIFLVQEPWAASRAAEDVAGILALTETYAAPGDERLILLPIAEPESEPVGSSELLAALGQAARAARAYLGGAAVATTDGAPRHLGFLFGPDGALLLQAGKTLPDMVAGFTDLGVDLAQPRDFAVTATPFGKIGMLIGEDILAPSLARMTAMAGAEVILNPTRERQDSYSEARQNARAARAYENLALVLCASPSRATRRNAVERLPAATAAYDTIGLTVASAQGDESLVCLTPDIEAVRRRRSETYANFPVVVRTGLYAGGYAASTPPAATPKTRADWFAEGARRTALQAATERPDRLDRYDVVIGQMDLVSVHDLAQRDEVLNGNIDRAIALTRGMARSPSVKLVVFPEFFMQGVITGRGLDYWLQVGVRIDGPEIARLQAFAAECSVFVSGMIYEVDPEWPDRYFNTAFIIDDEGRLIHRYRKIHGADTGLLSLTTPGNIYSDYVGRHGYDSLFPVVDTKIGRLATIICFDVNFPETARALARRGAEVLIHPTSEPHNARRNGWDLGRRTRAFENLAYVVSAGTGGQYIEPGDTTPSPAKRGHSKIVRFDGRLEASADGPGHLPLLGPIDLGSLRSARADARNNLVIWDEPGVYAQAYAEAGRRGFPIDVFLKTPMKVAGEGLKITKAVMSRYFETGVFTRPAGAPMAEQNMGAMYGAAETRK